MVSFPGDVVRPRGARVVEDHHLDRVPGGGAEDRSQVDRSGVGAREKQRESAGEFVTGEFGRAHRQPVHGPSEAAAVGGHERRGTGTMTTTQVDRECTKTGTRTSEMVEVALEGAGACSPGSGGGGGSSGGGEAVPGKGGGGESPRAGAGPERREGGGRGGWKGRRPPSGYPSTEEAKIHSNRFK